MQIERPIIIIGSGRSGSTIVFEALSIHPELGWMSNYDSRFPHSKIISGHHYFRRIKVLDSVLTTIKPQNKSRRSISDRVLIRPEEAYNKWNALCDVDFGRDYLHGIIASDNSCSNVVRFFSSVLQKQRKERLIIKITGPVRIDYLSSIFTDALFVHVKRDPRAVASSSIKTDYWQSSLTEPRWRNGLPADWLSIWENYNKHPIALLALQYRTIMELCHIEKSRIAGNRYMEIDYGKFVSNPVETVQQVVDFAGLTDSMEVRAYAGKPGRYKNMDHKYRSELSEAEIAIVEQITEGY